MAHHGTSAQSVGHRVLGFPLNTNYFRAHMLGQTAVQFNGILSGHCYLSVK